MRKFWNALGVHRGQSAIYFGDPRQDGSPFLHWSNENRRKGGAYGSILRNGRAWFHWGFHRDQSNAFGVQWVLGKWGLGFSLTVDGGGGGEHDLSGHLLLPGFALYWHLDRAWSGPLRERIGAWWRKRYSYNGMDLSVRVHSAALWWNLWTSEYEWHAGTPKWRQGNWQFWDQLRNLVLGKEQYTREELETAEVLIPLPEGAYPAKVVRERATWKRPRGRALVRLCWDFDIPNGLPIPGKGENSWDCGEDGIYGLASSAEKLETAVGEVVGRVLEQRTRYGSRDWRPAKARV